MLEALNSLAPISHATYCHIIQPFTYFINQR